MSGKRRWSNNEEEALVEMRSALKDQLDKQPPFPEGKEWYVYDSRHTLSCPSATHCLLTTSGG